MYTIEFVYMTSYGQRFSYTSSFCFYTKQEAMESADKVWCKINNPGEVVLETIIHKYDYMYD